MIEQIRLYNFQAWKKLVLDFAQVTTLLGVNDLGKSAIFRALYWVAKNHQPAKNFIRQGAERARVVLKIDGHVIERIKGKGVNHYKLDGKVFKAVGTTVPEAIAKILNVSDVNFQFQFEPPFWFSQSAPQVSRELNQIVNLGVIDEALSNLAFRQRRAKVKVELCQDRLNTARETKQELTWVVEFEEKLKELEHLEQTVAKTTSKRDGVGFLVENWVRSLKTRRNAEATVLTLEELVRLGDTVLETTRRRDQLALLTGEIAQNEQLIGKTLPDFAELDGLAAEIRRVKQEQEQLQQLTQQSQWQEQQIHQLKTRLQSAEEEYAASKPKTCPTCGRTW